MHVNQTPHSVNSSLSRGAHGWHCRRQASTLVIEVLESIQVLKRSFVAKDAALEHQESLHAFKGPREATPAAFSKGSAGSRERQR
jgi:hypothetical protein